MTDRFTPRRISDAASRTIDAWVDALRTDQLSLAALPGPLYSLYNLGVMDGLEQARGEVRAAQLDADRLWLVAFGEKDRRDYLLERLDSAAELANRPDVDDVLDEAWRIYLTNLDNIREPVRLATTEYKGDAREHAA